MSDLLNKKIVKDLRNEISNKLFTSTDEIKKFINDFVCQRVTEEDFGEMSKVKPTITERVGKGKKFIEMEFKWCDPNKDKPDYKRINEPHYGRHLLDPRFSIRIVEKK